MTTTYDVAVIGGGPAGLGAAVTARSLGASVVVIDENERPGGQLFKQIHKFFGSMEHHAGVRGVDIGKQLLADCADLGVDTVLNAVAWGVIPTGRIIRIMMSRGRRTQTIDARSVILACGATENAITFPGWTLPGVMGAGAVQTMINVHRVLPGKRVLMVGSGNVGLIVSYQLSQAGADVVCLCEALPRVGGYLVHAGKVRRAGIPILTSTTVKQAHPKIIDGETVVGSVTLVNVDERFREVPGSEHRVECDLVCLAVGLTPMIELALQSGCQTAWIPELGGHVPLHDQNMETTVRGLYVAGDIAGVEEASSALDEGRLAGVAAAARLGFGDERHSSSCQELRERLRALRDGPFGIGRRRAVQRLVELYGQRRTDR